MLWEDDYHAGVKLPDVLKGGVLLHFFDDELLRIEFTVPEFSVLVRSQLDRAAVLLAVDCRRGSVGRGLHPYLLSKNEDGKCHPYLL